ncbi:MAG: TetR/AcrR family transcriptional regulator [Candidatus Natronoplasma sp.]
MRKDPDDRKQELIDAAENLFSKVGFKETSVDDICDEVGVAHGLFYYYFDSKEDVIKAITERLIAELETKLEEIVEDTEMQADEKFKSFLDISLQRRKEKTYLLSFSSKKESPELYYSLYDETVEMLTPYMTKIVEQGIDEGIFNTDYPEQTIRFWLKGRLFLTGEDQVVREGMYEDMIAEAFMVERLLDSEKRVLTRFYKEKEEEIKAFLQAAKREEIK